MLRLFLPRPHRLAARTWPSQGQNTGSIPVGAMDGNRTRVRFPFLPIPINATRALVFLPPIFRDTVALTMGLSLGSAIVKWNFGYRPGKVLPEFGNPDAPLPRPAA